MSRRFALLSTVFLTGACALALEILSARVLAPVFGNALHVWAALITVTLGFLAVGYGIGGVVADRFGAPALGAALAGASATTLLVSWLRAPVLLLSLGAGFVAGSIVAAVLLFALPMTFLGMMVPIAVRVATRKVDGVKRAGRTSGSLFAVSTIGSVAGALLTGFGLAPAFRISTLLVGIAVALAALAVAWLAASTGRAAAAAGALLAALAAATALRAATPRHWSAKRESAWGETIRYEMRWSGPSRYSDVRVVDVHGEQFSNRLLFLDGAPQTVIQIERETGRPYYSTMPYTYGLQLAHVLHPGAERAMVIGVGGAGLCKILDEKGLSVDLSEIDPVVARVAKDYFGLRESLPVDILDGAEALRRATSRYDLVFLDAYHANDIPVHLVLPEFFAQVSARLADGGIFALNCMTSTGPAGERVWRAVARSVATAFPHVRVHALPAEETSNFLVFARREPLPTAVEAIAWRQSDDPAVARTRMPDPAWDELLERTLSELVEIPFDGEGPVLSADWNPLPEWQIPASLSIRRNNLESFPPEILIEP